MTLLAPITIGMAEPREYSQVGEFVCSLLCELHPGHAASFGMARHQAAAVNLLTEGTRVWAIVARANGRTVGIITLNECASVYADGVFGEISELYVVPAFRSRKVGAMLLAGANSFAVARGWPFLEVGAPGLPSRQRAADFYRENGILPMGPRLERIPTAR
jgi:GNAT superfamily N-acetyltransferase